MPTKKILFATMPMDGHLKPLTGLAAHLQQQGYDVRWYSGPGYAHVIEKLFIPFYPFQRAQEINQHNLEEKFPERQHTKGTVARLQFDMKHVFLLRIPEFIADLQAINKEFPFDLVICDMMFMASPFIKFLFGVPVIAAGIAPLGESSPDLPPAGMGLEPSNTFWGRRKQDFLRFIATRVLFKPSTDLFNSLLKEYGLSPKDELFFDALIRRVDVYWQSGVPGFEYPRMAISPNVQFVGPLLPNQPITQDEFPAFLTPVRHQRIILVTQGTVDRDHEKLLVPTLEAFRNDPNTLVIATTGGIGTNELRARFPEKNLIIEDYIDFRTVMPKASVFVTNAGYGGVLMAARHGLPMVAAGVHEGKSEIAARINYFGIGISLKTETPTANQVQKSVEKILTDPAYRRRVNGLKDEFLSYNTNQICQESIEKLLSPTAISTQLWH